MAGDNVAINAGLALIKLIQAILELVKTAMETKFKEMDLKIKDLNAQLEKAKHDLEDAKRDLESGKGDKESCRKKIDDSEKTIKRLKEEVEDLKKQQGKLSNNMQTVDNMDPHKIADEIAHSDQPINAENTSKIVFNALGEAVNDKESIIARGVGAVTRAGLENGNKEKRMTYGEINHDDSTKGSGSSRQEGESK